MDQLSKLISGLSMRQRISIVAAAVVVVAAMMGFVHYRREGDFKPLYTSMAPEDAAVVVQKLKESGVEHRLAENGATVMVPSGKLAESRLTLAAAGLPKTGRIGFELFDKTNFGATEFVEHINYRRALEGELERSIMSMAEVEQARVHLTLPKDSVFLDQRQPAKASVLLKLRVASRLSQQNVAAVTNLVASAVEGLLPGAVSLVDMHGNVLNKPRRADDAAEITHEAIEVRQRLERDLVAKISSTLEPLLGPDGFRVGASVECDLTSAEEQQETFDPTRSVMASSQKTEDVSDRASLGGVPGTASNLPNAAGPAPVPASGMSRRTENVTYQTSRVLRKTQIPQGVIRRVSLAVLLDQAVQWEGQGTARRRVFVPPPPETVKTIRDLVAGVTGFNAERGDQLVVETLPFGFTLPAEPPAEAPSAAPVAVGSPWQRLQQQLPRWALPAAAGLVVLLLAGGVLLLRRSRRVRIAAPVEVPAAAIAAPAAAVPPSLPDAAEDVAEIAPRNERLLPKQSEHQPAERVRQLTRQEPALAVSVLRIWLQDTR